MKFAQKLGYKGFTALKLALSEALVNRQEPPSIPVHTKSSATILSCCLWGWYNKIWHTPRTASITVKSWSKNWPESVSTRAGAHYGLMQIQPLAGAEIGQRKRQHPSGTVTACMVVTSVRGRR